MAEFEDINAQELEVTKLHQFDFSIEEEEDSQEKKCKQDDAFAIIVACGPFSYDDSLRYSPLLALIERIADGKLSCDLLILLGPLIDQGNEKII